jgi:hypothetical protein
MGGLPTGSPAALLFVQCPAYPGGVAGKPGRHVRAHTKGDQKANQGHAHWLLQCLVAAARPLEIKDLAEDLVFEFNTEGTPKLDLRWRWEDQEEAVMSASSLVMIVKDGDSRVVQFSRFSVKEFLTTDRLTEPIRGVSRYHIRLEAAHTIHALGVLLRLDWASFYTFSIHPSLYSKLS